jgi:hypothetical protein
VDAEATTYPKSNQVDFFMGLENAMAGDFFQARVLHQRVADSLLL